MPALTWCGRELWAERPGPAGSGGGVGAFRGGQWDRRAEPRLREAVAEWSYQVTRGVEKEETLLASRAFKL